MISSDGRFDLPELGVSVLPVGVWALAELPPPSLRPGLGVFLRHIASSFQLNVRVLQSQPGGAVCIHDNAQSSIPDVIVREWLITDGQRFVNACAYASAQQWEDGFLADCEALLRSLRLE